MIRLVLNRIVMIALSAALTFVAAVVAAEAVAALAGAASPFDGTFSYPTWWERLDGELSGGALEIAILVGVAVGGLLLALFEIWPTRKARRATLDSAESGTVQLDVERARDALRARLAQAPWTHSVRRMRVKVDDGNRLSVTAQANAGRPATDAEIERSRDELRAAVEKFGVGVGSIDIESRQHRSAERVR